MIIQSHWVKCNTCHELVLAREHKGPVCARPPLVVAGLFTSCYRQKQKLFSSCFLCNCVDAYSEKMSPRSEFESEVSEISPNFTRAVLRCAVVLWPIARFTDIFFLLIHKGWTQGMGRNEGGKGYKKSEINVEYIKTPGGGGREQNVKEIIGGGIIEKLHETFLAWGKTEIPWHRDLLVCINVLVKFFNEMNWYPDTEFSTGT